MVGNGVCALCQDGVVKTQSFPGAPHYSFDVVLRSGRPRPDRAITPSVRSTWGGAGIWSGSKARTRRNNYVESPRSVEVITRCTSRFTQLNTEASSP